MILCCGLGLVLAAAKKKLVKTSFHRMIPHQRQSGRLLFLFYLSTGACWNRARDTSPRPMPRPWGGASCRTFGRDGARRRASFAGADRPVLQFRRRGLTGKRRQHDLETNMGFEG